MTGFVIALIVFALAVIALLIGIAGRVNASRDSYSGDSDLARAVGNGGLISTVVLLIIGGILIFTSTFYQNGVGEAKVQVDAVNRTVVGTITEPGAGFKAPWVDFVEFDLFSQEVKFAGSKDSAPSYAGGTVNGSEVTVSVGGLSGGSTQGNTDIFVTYSIDPSAIKDIYTEYKTQERFTEQIIVKQILSISRQVPSDYSATEFRGTKRAEAESAIMDKLNERLEPFGVEVASVTIQDVRYPDEVEAALKDVEVANQKQQKAEAELKAAEVSAQQKVVEAQAEADANAILSQSLTPQVLQQRYYDTLKSLAAEGNVVITDGSGNVLLQK